MARQRRHRALRRQSPRKDQLARFVIFCEGQVTEPKYLSAFARLPKVREAANLQIRGMGYDPRRLVEEARSMKHHQRRQGAGATQYWCVFDVEAPTQHARLLEAVQMAHDNDIGVAVSNPCFELWLLLHYEDRESWIDNGNCSKLLSENDQSRRKHLDAAAYMSLFTEAMQRANKLETLHERAGREFPHNNPSSTMNRLLQAIDPTLTADKDP